MSQPGGFAGATLAVTTSPPEMWPCRLLAHVECIMLLIITLPKPSSNKELVRETTQIRKPAWAQQSRLRLSTLPELSPLARYSHFSIPFTDRIFYKETSVLGGLIPGLFIIVLFPNINFVIFTAAFVTGKYSPPQPLPPCPPRRLWSSWT